jgi:rod shape-determining protein MreD
VAISLIKHFLSFIFLAGLQILILNGLDISSFANPQVFIMFILLFPVNTEIWLCILSGFISGALIDGLANTNGIHAFAGTAIGFFRFFYIKYSLDKQEIEKNMTPNLRNMPFSWHFFYILICSLIYHWIVFFMEAFTFVGIGLLTLKALSSGIIATFIILLLGFLFSRKTTNV